jgi:D-psicose/D-tagatose/L-ribulose 3-epimerase
MHLSMHNWMRDEDLEVTVRRISRFGYESVEISGEPERYNTRDVARVLKENRIACWGAVTLMLDGKSLVDGSEAVRADSIQYAQDCVTMVKELEGHVLTIVPAEIGVLEPASTPEIEWAWAVDGMKEIYDHAQRCGVSLAIEPLARFETYFICRADQALALAEATGPDCGVCLDAFHINIEDADPFHAILDVGRRLVDFHVADTNRLACGMGHWDWARVVDTLRDAGYDGALAAEFFPPIDRTPVNPFPEAVDADPNDLSPERREFIETHGSDLLSEEFYSMLVEKNAETLLPLISS